jgi:thymidine kinase
MAKLYFKYGAVGAAKTADLIITAHNYEEKRMKVLVFTSGKDTRPKTQGTVESRIDGLCRPAEPVLDDCDIKAFVKKRIDSGLKPCVILVDEIQFFSPEQVDQLAACVDCFGIPVICYGLRADFRTVSFPASKRLFEIADEIEEIKTMCHCGKKATMNARISNGKIVRDGEQIKVGGNESYIGLCRRHHISGDLG